MVREWAIHAYKARLDSAIEGERWDEADRVRVAGKRRLRELVGKGGNEKEIAAARDALADSYDRLRLSKRVRIDKGALATATRLSADAETAGIAVEQAALPQDTARDVKERIIQILSSGNRRPWSTSELAEETARRVETVARAVSQLRAERKIISRRIGRHVLHRLAEPQRNTFTKVLSATVNAPILKIWSFRSLSHGMTSTVLERVACGSEDGRAYESAPKVLDVVLKIEASRSARLNSSSSIQDLLSQPDTGQAYTAEEMASIDSKAPLISAM